MINGHFHSKLAVHLDGGSRLNHVAVHAFFTAYCISCIGTEENFKLVFSHSNQPAPHEF